MKNLSLSFSFVKQLESVIGFNVTRLFVCADYLSLLGEGWEEGLSIEPPSFAPLPLPFSQREKGDIKLPSSLQLVIRTKKNPPPKKCLAAGS